MKIKYKRGSATLALMLAGLALSGCGDGYDAGDGSHNKAHNKAAVNTAGAKLASAWNGSWITLSGRVVAAGPNRFDLDYGSGRVTVEMDDWDWYHEGRALLAGDEVTVTGRVDRDFAERKKIEAASVYVKSLGTTFRANPDDEEDFSTIVVSVPAKPGFVGLSGIVSNIEGRRFTLDEPNANIVVDTSPMADNPLDATGKFRIRAGDRVQVWGQLTARPNEPVALKAEGIIIQAKDATKKAPGAAQVAGASANAAGPAGSSATQANESGPQGL
jgi:uncharacterized protein YdeI (BOF family)